MAAPTHPAESLPRGRAATQTHRNGSGGLPCPRCGHPAHVTVKVVAVVSGTIDHVGNRCFGCPTCVAGTILEGGERP